MDGRLLRRLNAVLTVFWCATIPVVLLSKGLSQSVPLLVFISIYANVAGHFSAWQSARVEENQDKEAADD